MTSSRSSADLFTEDLRRFRGGVNRLRGATCGRKGERFRCDPGGPDMTTRSVQAPVAATHLMR